jgi:hypothetical protein
MSPILIHVERAYANLNMYRDAATKQDSRTFTYNAHREVGSHMSVHRVQHYTHNWRLIVTEQMKYIIYTRRAQKIVVL